jgi:hypothetical protein
MSPNPSTIKEKKNPAFFIEAGVGGPGMFG